MGYSCSSVSPRVTSSWRICLGQLFTLLSSAAGPISSAGVLTRSRTRQTAFASASARSIAPRPWSAAPVGRRDVRAACSDRRHIARSASHARRGRVHLQHGDTCLRAMFPPVWPCTSSKARPGSRPRRPRTSCHHRARCRPDSRPSNSLRFERGALGGGQLLHPLGKAVAVDEMQRNRVLTAVGLDKRFVVGHIRIASELSGIR